MMSEGDRDVIIEPHLVEEEVEVSDTPLMIAATTSEERGNPLDDVARPPRVLESYPLALVVKSLREPSSQPGSPGGISFGSGTMVSLVSSASEQPTVQPITTPEDEEEIAKVDA